LKKHDTFYFENLKREEPVRNYFIDPFFFIEMKGYSTSSGKGTGMFLSHSFSEETILLTCFSLGMESSPHQMEDNGGQEATSMFLSHFRF
jgi:hypothetical protein